MGSVTNLVAATRSWVEQPYNSQMNLTHWVLFVGLLLIAAVLWGRVLAHIGE
jgi:hypothetical protein